MIKYSKVNRGYKYIFTNIDIFSVNMHWPFPLLNQKLSKILSHVLKKYLKKENLNIFGVRSRISFFL